MDAPLRSAAKPPTGRKMKARAPPPPGKPAAPDVHGARSPPRTESPARQQSALHANEDPRDHAVGITVVLPSGLEKQSVVNGSHAMMDVLVELCLQHHLNPSLHALEVRSADAQQPVSFKPNTPVGTLNVHTVFLKEKVPEEKAKPGPPKAPEKSVCLVVNYLRTQKAVVRVSPEVPLHSLLPVICAKCDVGPEHVVLLRDNVAGEELELSKSLNELGIKELYAWDNKRVLLTKTQSEPSLSCPETFRKASLGNDETDKEKKKFLGFFKVNKRSNKVPQPRLSGLDGDEDASKLAPSRGSNGCMTTPNSPSVNSRSITLGPSLSLSSISGMSLRSDLKKRRAPPPPLSPGAPGPPTPDKASEKVSLGSQMDLQKKKRRAPAPPLPQPPPPSPAVPTRLEDRAENRKSVTGVGRQVPLKPPRGTARGPPQLVLPPPPPYPPPDTDAAEPLGFPGEGAASEAGTLRPTLSLPLGAPLVTPEAEETVSVGSCFASEDTTEDSGVMSSPSDIVSLDSQHDSSRSKDKWATDQEDGSDQDLAGTPELGPQKSPLWDRNGPGNWCSRPERAAAASPDGRDPFAEGRFPQTLAGLDGGLEDMEDPYDTDTSSLTVNGVSGPYAHDALRAHSDADTIPVTFIGEVLDDPVESALFSNSNNNAGSFGSGSGTPSWRSEPRTRPREDEPCAPGALRPGPPRTCEQGDPELGRHGPSAKDTERGSASSGATPASKRGTPPPDRGRGADDRKDVLAPPAWHQRGHHPGGSFGLKYGLTTYKIIPPKSEMRCYDRGASLSTGAIEIDELGNLVCTPGSGGRAVDPPAPWALEREPQAAGKAPGSRRSDSVEKRSGQSPERWAPGPRTPTPAAPASPPTQQRRRQPTSPDPKGASPWQQPPYPDDGDPPREGASRPPTAAPCPTKAPAANAAQVLFLKPQRRTSSQYVASAIAKRIGPPRAHAGVARRQDAAGTTRAGRGPGLAGLPPATRDGATPRPWAQPHAGKEEVTWTHEHLPSTNGAESAAGAQPRGQGGRPHCPAGPPGSSCAPLITASRRDHASGGPSCGVGGKPSVSSPRTGGASEPTCAPPSQDSDQFPGGALVNGSSWVPICSERPSSPSASGASSHAVPGPEAEPGVSCVDAHDPDGALPSSIFGPKKKFRPVVQRPAPKDTSLHSALMEAIHSAGGKDRLRKTAGHGSEGGRKKPSYTEAESEHSALLAAIRGHRGACSLRKVASSASEELRSFRDAARSAQGLGTPGLDGGQPPPGLPPPCPPAAPAPPAPRLGARPSSSPLGSPGDARQALMDAIRSGTGAARLRKVPLLV